jgi:uncharacterized protein DUF4265
MNDTRQSGTDGQVKVRVPLLGSARKSGFESETLWAEPLGGNRYRIWNLPVFAYNLDMRAVVECRDDPDGGYPIVTRVVEPGDCYVIRLFFAKSARETEVQAVLDLLGTRHAMFEKYNQRVWAVGPRTLGDNAWVGQALRPFVEAKILEFESGMQDDEPTLGDAA